MGTTFGLYRTGQDETLQEDKDLPGVQAVFAFTEYPRFLRRLALDAGLREVWDDADRLDDELAQLIIRRLRNMEVRVGRQKSKKRKKGRRTRIKRWGQPDTKEPLAKEAEQPREREQGSSEEDSKLEALKQRVNQAWEAIGAMADREPLAQFLVGPPEGRLDSKACERIAPRLRAIAEKWEPAPEGFSGWREFALNIAHAMDFAAKHPDLVFVISE